MKINSFFCEKEISFDELINEQLILYFNDYINKNYNLNL